MSFRIDIKNVGLTYPQCNLSRQRVLECLRVLGGDKYQGAAVAQEHHKDGSLHIHAYLRLHTKRSFRDPRAFDIDGFHPNIQGVRHARKWLAYIRKEDTDALMDGDLESLLSEEKPKQRITDDVARRIESGATATDIFNEYPGFYLMNKRKIEELQEFMVRKRQRLDKLDWEEASARLADAQLEAGEIEVRDWLLDNIKKPRVQRQPQLWIQSEPGAGKTTLIQRLARYLAVFIMPMDGDKFYDGFADDYDLIVFDEMKSQFTLTWLNQFIDGSQMSVNVKGAKVLKTRNVPVIFLTNYGVLSAYSKMSPSLQAFLDRLKTVQCTSLHALNSVLESPASIAVSTSTSASAIGPESEAPREATAVAGVPPVSPRHP